MDKKISKQLDKYLKKVGKYLICKRKTKEKLSKYIVFTANEYYQKHPGCEFEDIKIYLGSPTKLSEQLMASLDINEIRQIKKRKFLFFIFVLVLFIFGLLFLLLSLQSHGTLYVGSTTVYSIISPR